jgi:hypothetical protein
MRDQAAYHPEESAQHRRGHTQFEEREPRCSGIDRETDNKSHDATNNPRHDGTERRVTRDARTCVGRRARHVSMVLSRARTADLLARSRNIALCWRVRGLTHRRSGEGRANRPPGRRQQAQTGTTVVRIASVSDEPSNTASERLRDVFALFTEFGLPPEEVVRAWLTDDYVHEDRRRGPSFPDADAESWPRMLGTIWETGAGRPRFQAEILAVRGDRFAAALLQLDYGNGSLFESIHVVALDATLSLAQRAVEFDIDDADGAIAELDRLHSQDDAH